MKRVAILETGAPPRALRPQFGDYPAMFRDLLGAGFDYASYDVRAALPAAPEDHDAYVITGSAAGVYEDLPWLDPLRGFLREAKGRAKLVGVCFGHQIMADAFGGEVIKSPKGWGVGLHRYEVTAREPWMDGAASFAIPASHQDQVVALPPGVRIVAASAFTPMAMLAWDDQPAISMQGHPEFDPAYATALIESRREERLTDEEATAAVQSLKAPADRDRVARWMTTFLEA